MKIDQKLPRQVFFSKIVPTKAGLKKTNEVARYLFRFYRMQQNAGVAVSRAPKTEGGRKFRFENKNKSEKRDTGNNCGREAFAVRSISDDTSYRFN